MPTYNIYNGVSAIVRADGSVSIYRYVDDVHIVLYDTMDHPSIDECSRGKPLAEIGKLAIEEHLARRRFVEQIAGSAEWTKWNSWGSYKATIDNVLKAEDALTRAIETLMESLPD